MALCSCFKSSTQLALLHQQRRGLLGRRCAVAARGSFLRTRVARPSTSSATPSLPPTVLPTIADVASKDDIRGLEQAFMERSEEFMLRMLLFTVLAVVLGVLACLLVFVPLLLVFVPLNPNSAVGMVVTAVIKKI